MPAAARRPRGRPGAVLAHSVCGPVRKPALVELARSRPNAQGFGLEALSSRRFLRLTLQHQRAAARPSAAGRQDSTRFMGTLSVYPGAPGRPFDASRASRLGLATHRLSGQALANPALESLGASWLHRPALMHGPHLGDRLSWVHSNQRRRVQRRR